MRTRTWIAAAVLVIAGAAGLWGTVSVDSNKVSSLARHMHEHLDRINAIKAAVIAGDLAEAREPALWLAEHEAAPGFPHAWRPFVNRMRVNANAIVDAQSLGSAAMSVSEIARACGDCHIESGFKIAFEYDPKPVAGVEGLAADMMRHRWAADRMWEGLIGPSDASWYRGTGVLTELTLTGDDVQGMASLAADQEPEFTTAELLYHVQRLGELGTETEHRAERSALYGDFLSRCAECHVLTGGGPGPRVGPQ